MSNIYLYSKDTEEYQKYDKIVKHNNEVLSKAGAFVDELKYEGAEISAWAVDEENFLVSKDEVNTFPKKYKKCFKPYRGRWYALDLKSELGKQYEAGAFINDATKEVGFILDENEKRFLNKEFLFVETDKEVEGLKAFSLTEISSIIGEGVAYC